MTTAPLVAAEVVLIKPERRLRELEALEHQLLLAILHHRGNASRNGSRSGIRNGSRRGRRDTYNGCNGRCSFSRSLLPLSFAASASSLQTRACHRERRDARACARVRACACVCVRCRCVSSATVREQRNGA